MPSAAARPSPPRAATHERWPVDRKVALVMDGLLKRRPIVELCREAGISTTLYYHWRNQFFDAARLGLAHPEAERHALETRLAQLEAENVQLKTQVRILCDLCVAD